MNELTDIAWWNSLRHEGLLLDVTRLGELYAQSSRKLPFHVLEALRIQKMTFENDPQKQSEFIKFVLEKICNFADENGHWSRAAAVKSEWGCVNWGANDLTKPDWLYFQNHIPILPVFIDRDNLRLGIGRGRNLISRILHWMRNFKIKLALLTNGGQWRIVYAGMDNEAFSEWEIDQWLVGGRASPELNGFAALVSPMLWQHAEGEDSRLLSAVNASRKGQNELSGVMGERVRTAVEMLIQAHGAALTAKCNKVAAKDIYMAGVRMIMRLVVAFFAESREGLLPKSNTIYNSAYSLSGLMQSLKRYRGNAYLLNNSFHAWPRLLALQKLIYYGSDHEAMPVTPYGGELFEPGRSDSADPVSRVIALFENEYADNSGVMPDKIVADILNLLAETKVRIRQGHAFVWQTMPIDFSSLGNEYIGILFESLLNFELRHTREENPMVFLNIGDQPALPLVVLESMSDDAIKDLFRKMKKSAADAAMEDGTDENEDSDSEPEEDSTDELTGEETENIDTASAVRQRAYRWAEKACRLVGLVRKPRDHTQSAQIQYQQSVEREAGKLIFKLVEPGEWYLVRWGGTRKGSGTFYTKPQLAIPTVVRTLRPLVYDEMPNQQWIPKKPEDIIAVKVCDPACGSGSFLLAALRYLTEALYASITAHHRLDDYLGKSIDQLIWPDLKSDESITGELLPCKPEEEHFERHFKTILRRYVIERCIYGVDLDPLGVELCRLSLWIETLDRELPMTFLDHKIKCGNSLVGTWFDQFMHYPLMAWAREGGDKGHKNGVHFQDSVWTNAIKDKLTTARSQLVSMIEGDDLFRHSADFNSVRAEYQREVEILNAIHNLNINDAGQRAEKYRNFRESPDFLRLKDAFDLWCALWFWPGETIDLAPMPEQFSLEKLSEETKAELHKIAARNRFFHWELEFPDVFTPRKYGFDAVLGNPPWDTFQPNSMEYFSNIDPMYRSYGKQEALQKQNEYFSLSEEDERSWLNYRSVFDSAENWYANVANPYKTRLVSSSTENTLLHNNWKSQREKMCAEREHDFRYQGKGKSYGQKLFVERAYYIAAPSGRIGLIVPSGIYSDKETTDLRKLIFLNCQWEYLFSFENRNKIFDIDSRFKFNPVILQKGGETRGIRAAFMRRNIEEWGDDADRILFNYPLSIIRRFSPEQLAIMELNGRLELELVDKIYRNSILLGADGANGWNITFRQGDFNMTSDSHLFPPREIWEDKWGYKPDEYSRWIKGNWKPIESLYLNSQIAPFIQNIPISAPYPYNKLKVKRSKIPAGIILSRDTTWWISENDIEDTVFCQADEQEITQKVGFGKDATTISIGGKAIALPLYEGCMIGHFDFSYQGWISGTGNKTTWEYMPWEEKHIEPHYLMGQAVAEQLGVLNNKLAFRDIGNATNNRTIYLAVRDIGRATDKRTIYLAEIKDSPCGNTAIVLEQSHKSSLKIVACILNSFVFDYVLRARIVGTHLSQFIMKPCPVIKPLDAQLLDGVATALSNSDRVFSNANEGIEKLCRFAISPNERTRLKVISDVIVGKLYGLDYADMKFILADCDHPISCTSNKKFCAGLNPKGFWRVDKERPPEQRQTVLTLVAFHELEKLIQKSGSQEAGIKAFLALNDGEGWLLPETLRLADYGLGHDAQAQEFRPVASVYGPRFYDWQLRQTPEDFRKECEIHAYNLNIGRNKGTVSDAGAVSVEPEIEQPSLF